MANPEQVERFSWALLTDLYELTMAYGYWRTGMAEREAVFHLSFREHPFGGTFTVACGLAHLCTTLRDFCFAPSDIEYLRSLYGGNAEPLFSSPFLGYLADLRFSCAIDAVEEGTVVFPHEPLVRVQGPLVQAQIIESLVLNVINFQTLVATKAARICRAAAPGSVLEFGLRRAQGESGAMLASRAAYIGGCAATSNVLAGKRYGIPVRGTHAHSWVMSFADERESFAKYAEALPNNCIFLVDTYDTLQGVEHAIAVARDLRNRGHRLNGVRLDSGDLATLSRTARRMLDDAGLSDALIVASNDLDEHEIAALKRQGARIDVWGVGTRLVTAYDQPALGGVYKLSALRDTSGHWQPKLKLSEQSIKVSIPGILQIRRFHQDGRYLGDVIYDQLTGIDAPVDAPIEVVDDATRRFTIPRQAASHELLVPVFRRGKLVYQSPGIELLRERTLSQLEAFSELIGAGARESQYRVGLERELFETKQRLAAATGARER